MTLHARVYSRNGKWFFSCCGKEFGGSGWSARGKAEAAARLHEFSHR